MFSVISFPGQTDTPSLIVTSFLILTESPIMHPFFIRTFFPIFAPSPTMAPLILVFSCITASGRITDSLISTFFPTMTFFPKTVYGPITVFNPSITLVSIATGIFISEFGIL